MRFRYRQAVVFLSLIVMSLGLMSNASAQVRHPQGETDSSVIELQRKVDELEKTVQTLDYRLSHVEYYLQEGRHSPGRPPQRQETVHACMIVDSLLKRTFVETASNVIDAEYKAREACQRVTSSGGAKYCNNNSKLKCDSTADNPRANGFVCIVTDSLVGYTFRGEGLTAVAAEGMANQACQKILPDAKYCSSGVARCAPN